MASNSKVYKRRYRSLVLGYDTQNNNGFLYDGLTKIKGSSHREPCSCTSTMVEGHFPAVSTVSPNQLLLLRSLNHFRCECQNHGKIWHSNLHFFFFLFHYNFLIIFLLIVCSRVVRTVAMLSFSTTRELSEYLPAHFFLQVAVILDGFLGFGLVAVTVLQNRRDHIEALWSHVVLW